MIEFSFKCDTPEELEFVRQFLAGSVIPEGRRTANAERCKKYRESKKAMSNDMNDMSSDMKSMSNDMNDMSNYVADTEERENEKEEEKEKRTKKEKEEERVKEKEEIFNICAEPEKAKPEKQIKHKYGNFQHVFLTDEDYARLQDDFPDLPERIQRLDDYLENNPSKHYANHNLTIRSWANKDAKQAQPKQTPKEKTFRDLRIEMESQEAAQDNFIDSFWRI